MKLSIVIPAYNEEAYLGDCLSSIFEDRRNGNYDLEIVVVNNASTDRTRKIALSFPGIKLVDEPRKGLTRARQAGYDASTGDLIANVDADTMLPSGWIEGVLKTFSKNPKLVALSGPFIFHDLPPMTNAMVRSYFYVGFLAYILNRYVFRVGSLLQGGNFIIRRWALEKIGGYDTNISFYGEDADMARRLHEIGPVKFTLDLPMWASGRRLIAEGVWKMAVRYSLNYFWILYFKKPFSEQYLDIRFPNNTNFQNLLSPKMKKQLSEIFGYKRKLVRNRILK